MVILYDIFFVAAFLLYFPVMLIRGKAHKGLWTRLGFWPRTLERELAGRENIWIHAVSVGEVMAVAGLIQRMKSWFPRYRIVCSCVTTTGYTLARQVLAPEDLVIYAPLDLSGAVRHYVRAVNPRLYLSVETEWWPNLYRALKLARVPVVIVNGRVSDKAYRHYRKIRGFTRRMLAAVKVFCLQSQEDADRMVALGADKDKVRLTGNFKFDSGALFDDSAPEDFGLDPDKDYLIAGSTHPGEEALILDVYASLRQEFPRLRFICAPRHVHRGREILEMVERKGFRAVLFSQERPATWDADTLLIVDTIGHLKALYQLATVVFIGKTFTNGGGQNMIEPAFFGKPVVIGPRADNFKDVVRLFLKDNALVQVRDVRELTSCLRNLLNNPEVRQDLGEKARAVVRQYQGAVDHTIKEVEPFLRETDNGQRQAWE